MCFAHCFHRRIRRYGEIFGSAMTITAPTRKHSRILEVIGAMVKLNTITIPTTGRTAFKDSANFCRIFGFNNFNIGLSFL